MSEWSKRAFCSCGWSDEPSFGNVWFTQQHYPCCPRCGGSCYRYEMNIVRYARRQIGTWKLFGLFELPRWEEFYETRDGRALRRIPIIDGRIAIPHPSESEKVK